MAEAKAPGRLALGKVWALALGALALVLFGPLLLLSTPFARLGQAWLALLLMGLWALLMAFLISFMLWSPGRVLAWLERRLRRWVARFASEPAELWLDWARQAHAPELARWCLAEAASKGNPEALFQEGLAFLEGGFGPGGQGAAVARWLKAAQQNHPEAAFRLAEALRTGAANLLPEPGAAVRWYQRSARLGFGPAAVWLAQAHALGDGVAKDATQAQAWAALAEQLQPHPALSHSVLRHDAAPVDPLVRFTATARGGLESLADQVLAHRAGRWGLFLGGSGLTLWALFTVLTFFWQGSSTLHHVPLLMLTPPLAMLAWLAIQLRRDRPQGGRDRLREAAEAGDVEACYRLGLAFRQGSPAQPRDDLSAGFWFRKAAEGGHREAMVALSAACLGGHGMLRNPREAARWAEAARTNQLPEPDAR
jgi:hypothetical protein